MIKSPKFSDWIFDSFNVTKRGLGLFRIFSALFILLFLLPSTSIYSFLGTLPSDFYAPPPGPMWLFDGFPSELVFYLFHGILITALLCLLIGFKTTTASLVTGFILLIIKGLFYSVGKINHDLLVVMLPLVMAFSGWGLAYSVDSWLDKEKENHQQAQSWPLVLLALMIGFMMFTAGFPKILGGWLSLETQATYGHFFKQFFLNGRQDLLANFALNIDYNLFWELMDYGTVFFEVGFLAAIFHSRTTKLFICFAVIFHFSIMVLLNIAFLHNFVAYAAFLNWTMIDKTFREWLPRKLASPIILTGSFAIIGFTILLAQNYSIPNLESDLKVHEFIILLVALPIAVTYIGRQIQQNTISRFGGLFN